MKMFCPKCNWVGGKRDCIILDTWEAILPENLRMQEAIDVHCCPECETPVENYIPKKSPNKFFVKPPEDYKEHHFSGWYGQDVEPLKEGVYEVTTFIGNQLNRRIFAYWDGSCWSVASPNPVDVLNNPSKWQGSWAWRGLKHEKSI